MVRSWEESFKDEFEIIAYSTVHEEQAMDCLRRSFFVNESVCIGSEINKTVAAQKDLERLCIETAKDGVSLLALHKPSGKIVGVAFNKIQQPPKADERSFFDEFRDTCTAENSKFLMQFMIDVDSNVDMFALHNIDCLLEVMFLAVLPEFGRKGLGLKLVNNSIRLAECMHQGEVLEELAPSLRNARPQAVSAIFSSNYSQKVGHDAGFTTLYQIFYKDITFNEKTFAERIGGEHKSSILVIKPFKK